MGRDAVPPAQEQQDREGRDRDDMEVLREEEHGEFDAGIFRVVAAHQLGVGLGEVERRPVGLGDAGQQEDHERGQVVEDVPVGDELPHPAEGPQPRDRTDDAPLGGDDRPERQASRGHHDGNERQGQGDLVGDHLGAGADPAEQRVLGAARPARQHDPVHRQRPHRQHPEEADVEVGDLEGDVMAEEHHRRAEGDRGEGQERGEHRDAGRQGRWRGRR